MKQLGGTKTAHRTQKWPHADAGKQTCEGEQTQRRACVLEIKKRKKRKIDKSAISSSGSLNLRRENTRRQLLSAAIKSHLLELMCHIKYYLNREIIFCKPFRKLNVDAQIRRWHLSPLSVQFVSCRQWIFFFSLSFAQTKPREPLSTYSCRGKVQAERTEEIINFYQGLVGLCFFLLVLAEWS